ncbi:MAG: hypothetical protein OEM24_13935, partial [Paracoccaceae bacterium]|nr:hypothetical protein [Paracoccaceae bacterium]
MSVDLERIKTAWEIDIREYEEHFSELVRTQATNGEEPSPEHRESVRQFWKATSHLLHQYVRTHAQLGHYLEPMPAILLSRLALHFDELGNGIVTDLIESARAPGRPTRYGERRDISRGISYLEAVEKGLIQNRAPVKTV